MKRLLSLVSVAIIATGGLVLVGCESNEKPDARSHDELFGGGNGEFGESPAHAGKYSNQSQTDQESEPLTANSD